MKNFKSLRENLTSRLVSKGVKFTTPGKRSMMEEYPEVGDILELELAALDLEAVIVEETEDGYIIEIDDMGEEILLGHRLLDLDEGSDIADVVMGKTTMDPLRKIRQSEKEKETMPAADKSKQAADFWNKSLGIKPVKEGRADDAFADLDREVERKKSVMDKDKGATASGPTDKDYSDNKPATSTGTTNKNYVDSKPATSPNTSSPNTPSVRKTTKWKDLPETDKEQWRRDRKAAGMPPIEENYEEDDGPLTDEQIEQIQDIAEAEYQGRNVQLNKPMAGDVAKSKVYVKGPSGRVVKVNFGDKNMTIKKNIPARRRSFRARHRCETPGPKHKARYWSCRAW